MRIEIRHLGDAVVGGIDSEGKAEVLPVVGGEGEFAGVHRLYVRISYGVGTGVHIGFGRVELGVERTLDAAAVGGHEHKLFIRIPSHEQGREKVEVGP